MATYTYDEVMAKAAKAEAAGATDDAAKLRAYAETLKPAAKPQFTPEEIEAKALRAEAAGAAEDAARLREYAKTIAPVAPAGDIMPPLQQGDMLGNLSLGGAAPTEAEMQKWPVTPPTQEPGFGSTAKDMIEGPMQAASAFGAGIMDSSKSPSREFIANDPALNWLPGFAQTGLSKVGDAGMAGLSLLGAGIGGAAGLTADVLPIDRKDKFAQDIMDASMFAVPELSGFSSVGKLGAVASPTVKAAEVAPKIAAAADDVTNAAKFDIPVLRTDIAPPTTFLGKNVQKIGEVTPWGVGGLRAEQQEARIAAAKNFATEFGADSIVPAIDGVAADLLAKRAANLEKLTGIKRGVIESLDGAGVVPMTRTVAEIDKQIAALKGQKMESLNPVIAKLEEFKASLTDQTLSNVEKNRAVIGESFSDPSLANIKGVGEKALNAVYGPLREDMGAFIKANGKPEDYAKWASANESLAGMAGELKNSTLKRALDQGEATPEVVRGMLFSQKPSDVRRLYDSLTPEGQASARAAIMQEALGKSGGLEALSPEKFKTQLGKMASQIGVFFKGEDLTAAQGLARALKLTERAGQANVAPLTGIQNLPTILGLGLGASVGAIKGAGTVLGVGQLAKWYERSGTKAALKAMAKATTEKAEASALKQLNEAIKDIAIPGAANTTNAPEDFRALYGRY